jgi:hypothetical protein
LAVELLLLLLDNVLELLELFGLLELLDCGCCCCAELELLGVKTLLLLETGHDETGVPPSALQVIWVVSAQFAPTRQLTLSTFKDDELLDKAILLLLELLDKTTLLLLELLGKMLLELLGIKALLLET